MQSRYYNPEIGRFISKDDSGYHDASNPIDSNLYAYVDNNPVNNTDANGHFINTILGGLFGAGYGWLSAKLTGGDPKAGAISGAIGGAIAGLGADIAAIFPTIPAIGVASTTILGSAGTFVNQILYIGISKGFNAKYFTKPKEMKSIIISSVLGGIFNFCGYGWCKSLGYGTPPPTQVKILQRLLYICNINIQDVRNSIAGSIAVNYIMGNKQLAINEVYDYLKKNR